MGNDIKMTMSTHPKWKWKWKKIKTGFTSTLATVYRFDGILPLFNLDFEHDGDYKC
jgi:hypothetical protein